MSTRAASKVVDTPLTENGNITKISCRIANDQSGNKLTLARAIVFTDSAGSPDTCLGFSDEVSVSAGASVAWVDFGFGTPLAITAGTYWLGIHWNSNADGIAMYGANVSGALSYYADAYPPVASEAFGAASTAAARFAAIATYTPGGATGFVGMVVTRELRG